MVVFVDRTQLPEALERLKSWKEKAPYSWRLIGCMHSEIHVEANTSHFFIVDQWPAFNAICIIPKKDCKYWFFFDAVCSDGHQEDFLTSFIFDRGLWNSCKMLENAIIHWPLKHTDTLNQLCEKNRLSHPGNDRSSLFVCDEDHLIPQQIPDGYIVTELTENDTQVVHSFWDYAEEGNTEFVRLHLVNYPSVGIRDIEGNLVAWDVCYYIGEMGMLYVMEGHRGKGLAKCAIYALAKKMLDLGRNIYSYAHIDNIPSVKAHEKCGFWMAHDCDVFFEALSKAEDER